MSSGHGPARFSYHVEVHRHDFSYDLPPELIAQTPEAYVELAVSLAQDKARMADYHATLPGRFRAGAICDEPAFAERMTTTLERMADGKA